MSLSFRGLTFRGLSFRPLAFRVLQFGRDLAAAIGFTSTIPDDDGYTFTRSSAATGYDPEENRVLDFSTDEPRFHTDVGREWPANANGGFKAENTGTYGTIDSALLDAYPLTFGGWIYSGSSDTQQSQVSISDSTLNTNSLSIAISTIGRPRMVTYNGTQEVDEYVADMADQWVHVVGVWASAIDRKLYINGVLRATGTASYAAPSGLSNTSIGALIRTTTAVRDGAYKGIRFYASELTAGNVSDWYDGTAPAGAEAIYLCDEGKGSYLNDTSGNGHHMAISGVSGNAMLADDTGIADSDLRGLLMEREGVNLFQHSNAYDESYWTKTRISLLETNQGPLGKSFKLRANTDNNSHFILRHLDYVSGSTYRFSFFAKAAGNDYLAVSFNATANTLTFFNVSTGVVTTLGVNCSNAYMVDIGDGWWQCHIDYLADVSGLRWTAFHPTDNGSTATFVGNDVDGVRLAGISVVNTGGYSYIKTGGATATRSGDLLRVTGATSPWSSLKDAAGTFSCEVELQGRDAVSGDQRYILDLGGPKLYVDDEGVLTATDGTNTITGGVVTRGFRHHVAWTWGDGAQQLALDGYAGTAGTWAGSLGVTFGIACDASADDNQLDGYIRGLLSESGAKSADKLEVLTAVQDGSSSAEMTTETPSGGTFTRGSTGTTESAE